MNKLKTDVESGGTSGQPAFLDDEFRNCFVVVSEAIDNETFSTEFVLAWGYLNKLFGRFAELMETSDSERGRFEQNIATGLSQSTIVQRYWHAHWVVANSKPDFRDRMEVEAGLAELCADVWQGRLRSPSEFPPEWFEALIKPDPKPKKGDGRVPQKGSSDVVLRSPYVRAKYSDIESMVGNMRVPVEVLPPLNRRSFVRR